MNNDVAYRYQYPDNLIARIFQLHKDTTPQFFSELKHGYEKRLNAALEILPNPQYEAIINHYKNRVPFDNKTHGLCVSAVHKLQRPYIKNIIQGNLMHNSAVTIDCLDLSNRAYNLLGRIGCKNIEDVIRTLPRWNDNGEMVCKNKLLSTYKLGKETCKEIIEEIHRNGFLKEEEYKLMLEETGNA